MTDARFPGDGRYWARLEAWRDGYRIWGRMTVFKDSGTGYRTGDPVGYGAHVAGRGADGSWTYDFSQYSSRQVWQTFTDVGAPGNYAVDGWVDMAHAGRADPGVMYVNVPDAPPAAPNTPTVQRVNDNNQSVFWKDNATVLAPYTALQVQRTMYDGQWSGWQAIAGDGSYNTSGNNRSYGDTGTIANRIYYYTIYVSNNGGDARSGTSVWVFTTPAAPSGLVATKQASGSIVLNWTRGTPHTEINTNIDYSTDGGATWTALVSGIAGNVTSYTHASPPAASGIRYRARHTIVSNAAGAVGLGLVSGYAQSATVPLTAPPLAPSALDPNGSVFDAVNSRVFGWQHNSADSSTQTAYELQYRVSSASSWTSTGKITSGVAQRNIAANTFLNGNTYQWQVRTWGAHADPSPWSSTATFNTSAVPQVAITTPGSTLAAALLTATWSYTDSEGTAQSAWEARLIRQGVTIEQLSGSGAGTTASFTTRLADATEYQVHVRSRDGSGLWSPWAQKSFTTSFPIPATPTIAVNWSTDTGTVGVTVTNPTSGGTVTSNVIQRSTDDGQTWQQVAVAPLNGTGFDRTVPVGQTVRYRAIAWTDLPSSAQSAEATINTKSMFGYWSGGNAFEQSVSLRVNYKAPPKLDMETGVAEKVLHHFAGRTSPVETVGTSTERKGSVEFMVSSVEELRAVRALALQPAPHLVRMPDGTTVFASISSVKDKRQDEGWYRISFSLTEVGES